MKKTKAEVGIGSYICVHNQHPGKSVNSGETGQKCQEFKKYFDFKVHN